jgi:hypothetical protein
LRALCRFARTVLPRGIEALFTTELAVAFASKPLWPEYVPFDADIEEIVRNEGFVVYAHSSDTNIGQCLFGNEDSAARLRPQWVTRWNAIENRPIVQDVIERAARFQTTPRAVLVAWMLARPFPVVPIISLPELIAHNDTYRFAVNQSEAIWNV